MKSDPISFRERNAMIDIFNEKKAKFKFVTCDILKSIFCCLAFLPQKNLKNSIFGRKVLNYQLGEV